ncbi:bis(5'-nucleosyl)-tetraphosphatase (symmetrical) YqeK [Breznakiella homolactica]|uniref:bis(5'-nucleosyl)-tetraphosphatase (symmetrical) n=1 Tax=Breznakiella homolactica TaxID=2798577 RepID=A0A7T8B9U3_9SPIR|nr:bis(5'-nucleosyl)-tetraphosphatase (symmetrical) YqeK [Breznakiella homolactica]QQO09964.1 bis(5'-nucleosyl)-tetraphosphatase (symmetrical) YqeK [Breznakiella homolactica]
MGSMFEEITARYTATGDTAADIVGLIESYHKDELIQHVKNVAEKSRELSVLFDADPDKAELASFFHDVSCVIPNDQRLGVAEGFNLEIFEEERVFPMILHQKLSAEIAERIFGIRDTEILSAVRCHTTLKANPSKLDMIVFISDKIRWDQAGRPPYLDLVEDNLKVSLEAGTKAFVNYLIENKASLKVMHPWLLEAYEWFR